MTVIIKMIDKLHHDYQTSLLYSLQLKDNQLTEMKILLNEKDLHIYELEHHIRRL